MKIFNFPWHMNKHLIKNFVVTGCSFTASILADVEPTKQMWDLRASHWPHTVFAGLGPANKNFVNLAIGAGGNTAAFVNLIYFLNLYRHQYKPDNTLIGFNITSLTRKDKMCDIQDHRQSIYRESVDAPQQLNLSWYPSPLDDDEILDHIIIQNACKVIESISYLEYNRFSYFFMLMNDSVYDDSPCWFQEFLDIRRNKTWFLLDDHLSMESYSNSIKGWRSPEDRHPNLDTNRIIGKMILDRLKIV